MGVESVGIYAREHGGIGLAPMQDLVVSWGESSRLNRLRQDDHRSEHGHDDARTHA